MPPPQQQQVFSDRYELVRHVARGGMAQVYLAKDLLLDRPVALKVLFPELSVDQSFVERFRREAQAAANLSHPNIVSIYDWGQGEQTYFIVMEYIDGHTLSSLIRQGLPGPEGQPPTPLDAGRAAAIGADVASALEFAHRHNVIHRDVKPGNVLLDKSGQVKVTDFGIARAVGAKEGLTQTGAVMGTATYFSPEQAQGYSVDARSDIYSLGVVLYEMVVGRTPFDGDNPVAIAYKHVREVPVLPSVANPAVPKSFEAIIMQAMAKDPDARYQTADALRADLMRFHLGQGVMAPEVTPTMVAATGVLPPARVARDATVVRDGAVLEDEERSRTALWAALLLLLLALLGVLIFFLGRHFGLWATGAKTLTVPTNLVGQPYNSARAELTRDGFTDVAKATRSSTQPVDQVLASTPTGGSQMKANGLLTLDVSGGPAQVGVPNEQGQPQAAAVADLTSKGFQDTVSTQPSPTVGQGIVISQTPPGGATAAQGSTVNLVVSSGPATVAVPSVANDDPTTADNALHAAGLNPTQKNQASSRVKGGLVIGTNPPAGTQVTPGSAVTVYVSTGPAQVTVPNVDGQTLQQAQAMLSAAGLTPSVTEQPVTDPSQNNQVLSSNPAQGTTVNQGSTVTLVVGQYTAPSTTTTAPPATTTTTAGTTTTG
ncbi:MAG TPA: Stk1 family PASTA domain-containing Ser/Thr kinase [Acidimicrobiales bacterium]|jgi:serine/threonine-protein kinase|nr:Stk1 family PASTA domain-containing Ser/Thr kinase [Acidimicrobiales bacterium]